MSHARLPLCVTDPTQHDNPIIFANRAFCDLTGYAEDEILGRNCRFLQGADTDPESIERLREVLAGEQVATVDVVNYRKDGSRFINALQLGPIYDSDGSLLYFFGAQLDVTKEREQEQLSKDIAEAELRHRLRNIVSVLNVIVRLTGEEEELDRPALLVKIGERIQALGNAHLSALTREELERADLREMAERIVMAYSPSQANISFDGPAVRVGASALTPLAIVLHELATNAVKHGALSNRNGRVALRWSEQDTGGKRRLTMIWEELDGPPINRSRHEGGSKMIADLLRFSKGSLDYDWRPDGLVATVELTLV